MSPRGSNVGGHQRHSRPDRQMGGRPPDVGSSAQNRVVKALASRKRRQRDRREARP